MAFTAWYSSSIRGVCKLKIAHVGWIILGESKHNNTRLMSRYAPDLAKDPFYIWLNNYHWLPMLLVSVALYFIGGVSMVL